VGGYCLDRTILQEKAAFPMAGTAKNKETIPANKTTPSPKHTEN
jgi:hypothetical protein